MPPTSRRIISSKPRTNTNDVDDLSHKLASKLVLSDQKSKQTVSADKSSEDKRNDAMRAINSHSQDFTLLMQSGWKPSENKRQLNGKQQSVSSVKSQAVAVRASLQLLRSLSTHDIDVERAASSLAGKLILLDLHDYALDILADIHESLILLYSHKPLIQRSQQKKTTPTQSNTMQKGHILSLPLSSGILDSALLKLITTYLLHSLTAFTSAGDIDLNRFADILSHSETLNAWIPACSSLPTDHIDSICTRAYTTLTKFAGTRSQSSPRATFDIRFYSLHSLLYASPSVIPADTFWDQVTKFAILFIKGNRDDETSLSQVVLDAFSSLIDGMEHRSDKDTFLTGKGFVRFSECWMGFAKKNNDFTALERITVLISGIRSCSTSMDVGSCQKKHALDAAKLCAALTQITIVLDRAPSLSAEDQHDSGVFKQMSQADSIIKQCALFLTSPTEEESDERYRVNGKVGRALERFRRTTLKIMESSGSTQLMSQARTLLERLVDGLESSITQTGSEDLRTSALDTLFILARTLLDTSNADTYTTAYNTLERATRLARSKSCSDSSLSNHLRSVSTAFHALGGSLYQAGRNGAAVRFIQGACMIGKEAVALWRQYADEADAQAGQEMWRQLEEHLYRRWELLGVCHSRTVDHLQAYDAFVQSIRAYPFTSESFVSLLRSVTPQFLFDAPQHNQIGTIIDRVTYMGVSDLFKSPDQVSLRDIMQPLRETSPRWGDVIIGAILERQIDGLERSVWKESVKSLVCRLLEDALEIYGDRWPLRRMRILLRCLEFSYHAGNGEYNWNPDDMLKQVVGLSGQETFGEDSLASHFKFQYLAAAHLWMTLHSHQRGQSQLATIEHAEEACKILRSLLISGIKTPQTRKLKNASLAKAAPVKSSLARKPRKPPTTPKRKDVARRSLPRMSLAGTSPKPTVPFDQLHRLAGLLQMTAQLLGLLGHAITKVHLLTITRRLMEHNAESDTDDYVRISVDLAHEHVKLGRLEKASLLYAQTLSAARNSRVSEETRVLFFLRFAESSAIVGNVLQSATMYCEAQALSDSVTREDKGMPTALKVRSRIGLLERAAMAANAFAMIQYRNDDPSSALAALLQSLRLYNRAVDTLARLHPVPTSRHLLQEDDPFAAPEPQGTKELQPQLKSRKMPLNGLEWRICDGLLTVLFALAQAYFARGSAREAIYFAQQAQDLAESIQTPAMVSRALARKGEIFLYLGQLDEGYQCIVKAADLINGMSATDAADIRRLHGDYSQRNMNNKDAQQLYGQAMAMLEELQQSFMALDGVSPAPRRSGVRSPRTSNISADNDTLLPSLLASVLRQHIWLLRDDDATEKSKALLSKFHALPASAEIKAEENVLMAKLALHEAYTRFRADMFLSSLAESTIALPMGMSGNTTLTHTTGTQDISVILMNAEKLFWSDLALIARRGQVSQIREAAISLALIRAFQTSLGKAGSEGPILTAQLLDASTAITLRREMLEAIQFKFLDVLAHDDLKWPMITQNGSPLPPSRQNKKRTVDRTDWADGDDFSADDAYWKKYWDTVVKRYRSPILDAKTLSISRADRLPTNWTVVNISVTEDKSTMFISRQRARRQPIIFCLPLKGRRESEDDKHLIFDDAVKELKEIINLNDETTKKAVHVNKHDKRARSDWWAERSALDARLRVLLDNIEFCWLGAFKTILSEPMDNLEDILSTFRTRLEGVFQRGLVSLDKKQLSQVQLDDGLLECLATLSPKCRDEELEDLIYFILDLYQFHGIPVAIAEVDIDQLTIDLRNMLEEYVTFVQGRTAPLNDNHTFLVLDKNVEGIPWESIPALRGKSTSRVPNFDFILDRLDLANQQRNGDHLPNNAAQTVTADRVTVDPRKTFYALNPSGDLKGTEGRFSDWLTDMKGVGWRGLISRPPSEQQFLDALSTQDLVLYFGHGGGEQYARSHKIRHLRRCAATMLWGCSSGAMADMGEFDRIGTPYNYMLAGCPTLIANIWDVTDRDIDKFAQSVFDKMRMTKEHIGKWTEGVEEGKMSVVTAVAQSRDSCKLKYLTGAAPIVYGIPFYL